MKFWVFHPIINGPIIFSLQLVFYYYYISLGEFFDPLLYT